MIYKIVDPVFTEAETQSEIDREKAFLGFVEAIDNKLRPHFLLNISNTCIKQEQTQLKRGCFQLADDTQDLLFCLNTVMDGLVYPSKILPR